MTIVFRSPSGLHTDSCRRASYDFLVIRVRRWPSRPPPRLEYSRCLPGVNWSVIRFER